MEEIRGLDPVLPLSPGRAERHGFEYYRHGTLSLYAALDTASGRVHGKTAARHTSRELVAFLMRPGHRETTSSRSSCSRCDDFESTWSRFLLIVEASRTSFQTRRAPACGIHICRIRSARK
jgi:hypothetical protein